MLSSGTLLNKLCNTPRPLIRRPQHCPPLRRRRRLPAPLVLIRGRYEGNRINPLPRPDIGLLTTTPIPPNFRPHPLTGIVSKTNQMDFS